MRPIPSTKDNLQGLSTLKIKVKRRLRIRCHRPAASSGDNVSKWNFAWALHVGLAYRVSPNFTVELAYRYLDMGDGLTGDLRAPDGTNTIVNPTTFKSLTSHDLKMGVRWQLDSPPADVPPLRRG